MKARFDYVLAHAPQITEITTHTISGDNYHMVFKVPSEQSHRVMYVDLSQQEFEQVNRARNQTIKHRREGI